MVIEAVRNVLREQYRKPTEQEYYSALQRMENATSTDEYEYYKGIVDAYEYEDNLYHSLLSLSYKQGNEGQSLNSRYILTNGKIVNLNRHSTVKEINDQLSVQKMLEMGNIRLIGGNHGDNVIEMELSTCPNEKQKMTLFRIIPYAKSEVYIDAHTDEGIESLTFNRRQVGADIIINAIEKIYNRTKYIGENKQQQLQTILNTNPASKDNRHTWIRTVDDIKTYQESLIEYFTPNETNYDLTPDFKDKDVRQALKTNKITIYSSYPIQPGVFVTPSRMEAQSYAGNNNVYSKYVELSDVAWIDPLQGQYAKTP